MSSGSRWKNWKTKPTCAAAQRAQRALGAAVDALAGDLDRARLGAVEPPSRCSSVDLPEPERPRTATTSPARDVEVRAVEHAARGAALAVGLHEPARADDGHAVLTVGESGAGSDAVDVEQSW